MVKCVSAENRSGKLSLKGALVIQRAAEMKQELKDALEEVDTLLVDLCAVSEVDLACLQLLCSAHRFAALRNKTLSWIGVDPPGMFGAAELSAIEGCPHRGAGHCFWQRAEEVCAGPEQADEEKQQA